MPATGTNVYILSNFPYSPLSKLISHTALESYSCEEDQITFPMQVKEKALSERATNRN
jgi:hypothetical protein